MLNSNSLSMIVAIRNCVEKSRNHLKYVRHTEELENRIRHLENHVNYLEKTIRRMNSQEEEIKIDSQKDIEEPLHEDSIPYEEAFRMATLGGASGLYHLFNTRWLIIAI